MPDDETKSLSPFLPGAILLVPLLILRILLEPNINSYVMGSIMGYETARVFFPSFILWVIISLSKKKWSKFKVILIYCIIFFFIGILPVLSKMGR